MKDLSSTIRRISAERIKEELFRLIDGKDPRKGLEAMRRTGLMHEILPELERTYRFEQGGMHEEDLYEHLLLSLETARDNGCPLTVKLAALFHDLGKVDTRAKGETREKYDTQLSQTYGFTVGGPVIKNKLFIFASAEYYKKTYPNVYTPANGSYNDLTLNEDVILPDGTNLGNVFNNYNATISFGIYAAADCTAALNAAIAFGAVTDYVGIFTLEVNGESVPVNLTYTPQGTADWSTFEDFWVTNVDLKAGNNTITFTITGGCGNFDCIKLVSPAELTAAKEEPEEPGGGEGTLG